MKDRKFPDDIQIGDYVWDHCMKTAIYISDQESVDIHKSTFPVSRLRFATQEEIDPPSKSKSFIDKFKPFVYCYSGSGMLTNTVDKNVEQRCAEDCANIAKEVSIGFNKWRTSELVANSLELLDMNDHEIFELYINTL